MPSTSKKRSRTDTDAISLLKQDHKKVRGLLKRFESDPSEDLLDQIEEELKVHTQIEEEIFYPAARKATGDEDLLDEALVEHAGAKHLISEIEAMKVGDDLYDAKIRVLGEQVKHHVKEEEEELFPEIESSEMDVAAVGKQLADRKAKLMARA